MSLEIDQQVGRYVVDARLGSGGMATVYKVRHEELGSPYALKVLDLVTAVMTQRFRAEGQFQARLDHPNVVKVFDVMEVDGRPALLLEFVQGESLREWMLLPHDLDVVLAVFRDVVAGVAAAHEVGLVHRDLKPENVLMGQAPDGRPVPKVADFGIAKHVDADGPTQTGFGLGTPGYMAPEQIRQAKDVDLRADVFALGVMLYELTCGLQPFRGSDTLEIVQAAASGDFLAPTELRPELPPEVEETILGCLVTNRTLRFQSCSEVLASLDGTLKRAPTEETWVPDGPVAAELADDLGARPPLEPARSAPSMSEAQTSSAPTAPTAATPDPVAAPASSAPWALVGLVAVAMLLLGGFVATRGDGPPVEAPEATKPGPMQVESLAVRPFTVVGAPDKAWIGTGLAVDLTFALADSNGPRTVSQSVWARYNTPPAASTVGADLGIDAVIEGTVRVTDAGYTVQTTVVSAEDDSVLWTDTHTDSADAVSGPNGVVANALLTALGLEARPVNESPERLSARVHFLQGREIVREYDESRYAEAEAALKRALAIDAGYGDAHATLARLYMHLGWSGEHNEQDYLALAEAQLREGLGYEPNNPRVLRTMGRMMVMRGQLRSAFQMFNRAVEHGAKSADIYIDRYEVEVRAGALELARRDIEKAVDLDPYYVRAHVNRAWFTTYAEEYDQLDTVLNRAREHGVWHVWLDEAVAGSLRRSRQPEALEAHLAEHPWAKSKALHERDEVWLGAKVDDMAELGASTPNPLIERARYEAALGRTDDALATLKIVLAAFPGFRCHLHDPVFDDVMAHADWPALEAEAIAASAEMSKAFTEAHVP